MFPIALLLAAALGDANNAAPAYVGANPVVVAACSVEPEVSYYDPGIVAGRYAAKTIGERLNITFTNTANAPISSVTFAVRDGNHTQYITDAGTFSSGVTIDHSFKSQILDKDHVSCSGTSVTFANGSMWSQTSAVAQMMK